MPEYLFSLQLALSAVFQDPFCIPNKADLHTLGNVASDANRQKCFCGIHFQLKGLSIVT